MPKVFKEGDWVNWVSSSNGRTRPKKGKVVEVVKIGKRPCQDKFRDLHKHSLGAATRIHESYVISVQGKFYWPVVAKLTLDKPAPLKLKWVMPVWMKPYVPLISNTGGNSIEELMNDDGTNSNVFVNAPRALICVAVKTQVGLLESLYNSGKLKDAQP